MQIWVDADACPNVIKEILFRAAQRTGLMLTLVANAPLRVPRSSLIRCVQVPGGFDEADNWIAQQVAADDLVITADIPLAALVIEKNAYALNPRGELYTKENIGERLNMRNIMDQLRGSGVVTGGPNTLSLSDRNTFASRLDTFLARRSL